MRTALNEIFSPQIQCNQIPARGCHCLCQPTAQPIAGSQKRKVSIKWKHLLCLYTYYFHLVSWENRKAHVLCQVLFPPLQPNNKTKLTVAEWLYLKTKQPCYFCGLCESNTQLNAWASQSSVLGDAEITLRF